MLAHAFLVAFVPCGFAVDDETGAVAFALAPNYAMTYVNPKHVTEVIALTEAAYGGPHQVECSLILFINGDRRFVKGDAASVKRKLAK